MDEQYVIKKTGLTQFKNLEVTIKNTAAKKLEAAFLYPFILYC